MSDDVLQSVTDRPLTVLVTGSAGAIGRAVAPALVKRGHRVRGLDRQASDLLDDEHVGDLADRAAVDAAFDGVDAAIHLAACPDAHGDFIDDLLRPNFIGLYHVLEAARAVKIQRLVLASSIMTVDGVEHPGRPLRPEDGVAPMCHYALSKVYAEEAGRMYARLHGMSVLAVRIGWYPRGAFRISHLGRWRGSPHYLSPGDAARFFIHAIEAPHVPGHFAVLFASSKVEDEPRYDPQPARDLIGYEGRDVFPAGCTIREDDA